MDSHLLSLLFPRQRNIEEKMDVERLIVVIMYLREPARSLVSPSAPLQPPPRAWGTMC
jgi:hypothetical protein